MLNPKKAAEVAQARLASAVEELVIAEAMCQYLERTEAIDPSRLIVPHVKGAQSAAERAMVGLDHFLDQYTVPA